MKETKKIQRIRKRREKLEEAVQNGLAFCEYHNYLLDPDDIHNHRCHTGKHGHNYCQYLRMSLR